MGNDIAETLLKLRIAVGGKPRLRQVLGDQAGGPVSDVEVETAWELISDPDGYQIQTHQNYHLSLMGTLLPGTTAMFHDRGWRLIRFERKALITSNTPAVLLPAPNHPPYLGIGLATAGGVLVPLDRRVALLMDEIGTGDAIIPGTAKRARSMNQALANNARRYVFHHPDDDPLQDIELPQPRERETRHCRASAAVSADTEGRVINRSPGTVVTKQASRMIWSALTVPGAAGGPRSHDP